MTGSETPGCLRRSVGFVLQAGAKSQACWRGSDRNHPPRRKLKVGKLFDKHVFMCTQRSRVDYPVFLRSGRTSVMLVLLPLAFFLRLDQLLHARSVLSEASFDLLNR
eukprot:2053-Heterococcus_DN1.PRE.1